MPNDALPAQITSDVVRFAETQTAVVARATALVVSNAVELDAANELLKAIKSAIVQLELKRTTITKPLDATKKAIMDFFKPPTERLQEAERIVKQQKIGPYLQRVEAERQAEERRLQEAAEKERQRIAAESRRKEEQAAAARAKAEQEARDRQKQAEEAEERRRKAEAEGNAVAAAKAAAEAAKAQEQARNALLNGSAKADELQAQAHAKMEVSQGIATPTVERSEGPKGLSARKKYDAEVVNKMALIKAIAEGVAPATLLKVDETALRQYATAVKEGFNLPGCRLVTSDVIASRA